MSPDPDRAAELRSQILDLVREYHDVAFAPGEFRPGESQIHFAGRVFDEREVVNLVDSSLEFWLTTGPWAEKFEKRFARLNGLRHALLVNSGSSANLVALSCLTSTKLGDRRLRAGRRGDHGGEQLSDDRQPDHPERPRSGLRRRHGPDLQHRRDDARGRALGPHQGDHGRPHARETHSTSMPSRRSPQKHDLWLIEDCCDALGFDLSGAAGGELRRPRVGQLLPGPPHHDGRGRLRPHQQGPL